MLSQIGGETYIGSRQGPGEVVTMCRDGIIITKKQRAELGLRVLCSGLIRCDVENTGNRTARVGSGNMTESLKRRRCAGHGVILDTERNPDGKLGDRRVSR